VAKCFDRSSKKRKKQLCHESSISNGKYSLKKHVYFCRMIAEIFQGPALRLSRLNKAQMVTLWEYLKKQLEQRGRGSPEMTGNPGRMGNTVTMGKEKNVQEKDGDDSIMDLYFHTLLHLPFFFKHLDFRNVNTKRAEGFLAEMKFILEHFTTRNFGMSQTLLEVIIRHHYQSQLLEETGLQDRGRSKISRLFDCHVFEEMFAIWTFMPFLEHYKRKVLTTVPIVTG